MRRLWRRLRSMRLGSVVLLTAVPGLLLPTLFLASGLEFCRVAVGLPGEVHRVLERRDAVWGLFLYKLREASRVLTFNARADRVPTGRLWADDEVHLSVPGSSMDALLADLPVSGETYQRATVWNVNRYRKVRLRIRGNSGFHWLFEKRSLKLRTSKRRLLRGYRDVNLTVKYPYVGVLAGEIADEWGLLAPAGAPVKVYMNDELYGVLRFLENIDESFLRRHERMPGDIFKGEGSPFTNEYHHGVPVDFLLRNPYVWPKVARDNSVEEAYRRELVRMAEALDIPEPGSLAALQNRFDRDTVVRHVAYHLFLNEWHAVDGNNLKLYLDPLDGKLYPIVWDPYIGSNEEVLSGHPEPEYPVLNHVFYKMGSDPRFMRDVFSFLVRRLERPAGLLARIDRLRARMIADEPAFAVERENPWFPLSRWFFEHKVRLLAENRGRIVDLVAATSLQLMRRGNVLLAGCRGPAGVDLTALEVGGPSRGAVILDRNRNLRADPGEPAVRLEEAGPGGGAVARFQPPLEILPAYTGINRVDTRPLAYPLILPEGVTSVRASAVNGITGKAVTAETVTAWEVVGGGVVHPWDRAAPERPETTTAPYPVWRLTGDVEVPVGAVLRIRPGTRVRLGSGVTIRAYGRIEAVGTPERPIDFEPLEAARPWGCLALQGPGSSGSRFNHVRFRGGSRARFGALHYSGMVNVHRARSVRFERCEFSENVLGDDALRGAGAELAVLDCSFHDVNADAIDLDHSEGTISGCTFDRVGNDGIDLMTSSPLITGCTVAGCQDKGISVGERADPLVFNDLISGCSVGVEIKDGSDPLVLNSEIVGCGVGVNAYRKNWRYAVGGYGRVVNSVVAGNRTDLTVGDRSRVVVRASRLGRLPDEASAGRTELDRVESGGRAPEPDREVYARLIVTAVPPAVGRAPAATSVRRRPLLAGDRFEDGFAPRYRGWRLRGSPRLFVEGRSLRAAFRRPGETLGKTFGLEELPAGARLHLRLGASRPARLTVAIDGGRVPVERVIETDGSERSYSIDLEGPALRTVRLTADRRTTLRLIEAAVSVP